MRLLAVPLFRLCVGVALALSVAGTARAYLNLCDLGFTPGEAAELDRKLSRCRTKGEYDAMLQEAIEAKRARVARAAAPIRRAQDPADHFQRGVDRMQSYLWKEAEDDFTAAIRLDPKCTRAYCQRARARYRLRDYDGCQRDFKKALELEPRSVSIRLHRALAIIPAGDEDRPNLPRAVKLAEEACELAGRDAQCLQVLAAAHARAGDFDQAREVQLKALRLVTEDELREARRRLERYEKDKWNVIDFDAAKIDAVRAAGE